MQKNHHIIVFFLNFHHMMPNYITLLEGIKTSVEDPLGILQAQLFV